MNLIFFIILRIISNPIANVFQKKLVATNSSVIINLYTYLILSILCCPFIGVFFSQEYGFEFWSIVILAGLLCALGTLCMIKAVSIGELSILGPINSYKSLVGLISSILILKEIPSLWGIIGIFLIIWGSKYIFNSVDGGFSFELLKRKEIQLRLLALILTGIEASLLKKIIIMSSTLECFILWCFSGLLWSLIFAIISKKNFAPNSKKDYYQIIIIAILLGLMQYSTNYVFERMNVGYALALFQLSSLVTVFLGYKVFKEGDMINKIIGSTIMIIGSCLIILH